MQSIESWKSSQHKVAMEQFVTNLFFLCSIIVFTFSILQLTSRRKTAVTSSITTLFFLLGYVWLYYGMYRYNRLAAVPWMLYTDISATFMIGPVFFIYHKNLTGCPFSSYAKAAFQFIPAGLSLLYLIVFHPASTVSFAQLQGPNPDHFQVPAVRFINALSDLHFCIYALLSLNIVIRLLKDCSAHLLKHIRIVLLFFVNLLLAFIAFITGHILKSENILCIGVLLTGMNGIFYFFISYRYPEYTQQEIPPLKLNGKTAVSLPGIDVARIITRLETVMESENGFRDSGITLQSLSILLGIKNHQLSKVMNDHLNCNFRTYINQRRLSEAKRTLTENPDRPIMEVAYAVGFNSKTAFNTAFSRESGMSPSNYRKKSEKKVPNS